MQVVTEYQTRVLDQEPDAIAICPPPFHDYILIGTYSLTKSSSGNVEDDKAPSRRGSLQIIPFTPSAGSSETTQECLVRQDFNFGVYDLHFHDICTGLLGVATSDGRVMFFRLGTEELELNLVGWIMVEEEKIITQFTFLPDVGQEKGYDVVKFVATSQSGRVKGVKVNVPGARQSYFGNPQASDLLAKSGELDGVVFTVHRHDEGFEAWTVSTIPARESDLLVVVSGGDDSRLTASMLDTSWFSGDQEAKGKDGEEEEEDEDEAEEDKSVGSTIFTERRTHEAGVVSLLPLGRHTRPKPNKGEPAADTTEDTELLLTGSYDEHIRLFTFSANTGLGTARPKLRAEMKLPGGVWRITLLDSYYTNDWTENANPTKLAATEYVLLIAGHLGGAFIVRLIQRQGDDGEYSEWSFSIEAEFAEGHESLVYACVARSQGRGVDPTRWKLVSSSFYDMKVCNWTWTDPNST